MHFLPIKVEKIFPTSTLIWNTREIAVNYMGFQILRKLYIFFSYDVKTISKLKDLPKSKMMRSAMANEKR